VVKHVARLDPESRLYAVGWSLGRTFQCATWARSSPVHPWRRTVSLCNPFDLVLADKNFHIGLHNVYEWPARRQPQQDILRYGLSVNFSTVYSV